MSIQLAYGIEVLPHDDPHVLLAEKALDGFANAASPGAFLVDILHFLKHVPSFMPGAGFKKQALIWRQWMLDFVNSPFTVAMKEIVSNLHPYSYVTFVDVPSGRRRCKTIFHVLLPGEWRPFKVVSSVCGKR